HSFFAFTCFVIFIVVACRKESSEEWGNLPLQPPVKTDSTIAVGTDTVQTAPVADTTLTTPPKDTTKPATLVDTTTPAPPPAPLISIAIKNPSFEDSLHFWKKETAYRGRNGFKVDTSIARTGRLGLNFYAAQPHHFLYAKEETPWNGKIYQTVTGLKDGHYTYRVYADAVGNGMYLWADGGTGEVNVLIKSDKVELNTLEFDVKGGVAKFGFICINAGGPQQYAPYFHADDVELLLHP
ncbi:MAG TPA: hypothetical protein VM010_05030, partial [Chitinophagaceae bacterium]|nr:hypothetical protein [Chitinophagaceae bacterium]